MDSASAMELAGRMRLHVIWLACCALSCSRHSPACCAANTGCSIAACARLHKQARCVPQLRRWLLALAPLAILLPSLSMSGVVTGTTSSVVLRKCGSWCA